MPLGALKEIEWRVQKAVRRAADQALEADDTLAGQLDDGLEDRAQPIVRQDGA